MKVRIVEVGPRDSRAARGRAARLVSGIRSRQRGAAGAVETRLRSVAYALGQSDGDLPLTAIPVEFGNFSSRAMDDRYNHAPNRSPRSGSDKKVAPAVWAAIVVIAVLVAIWFQMKS